MSVSLEQEIVALQDLHGSSRDPYGTAFVPLADAHRRAGEFDKALALLRDGLTRHPEYTPAHVVTSWVHIDRGALDEALGALELVMELDHDNRAGLKGLGHVLNEKGDREGAIGHLTRLAELEPEDGEARTLFETIQAVEPVMVPETEPPVEVSEEEAPDAPEPPDAAQSLDIGTGEDIVTRTMGEVYAAQGLFEQAIGVFEQLVADAPDDDGLTARLEELRAEALAPLVVDDPLPGPVAIDELAPDLEIPSIEEFAPDLEIPSVEEFAPEPEIPAAEDRPVVSIDALAPSEVAEPAVDDRPAVAIGSLAPEGERPVAPIALLAPDAASGF